MFFSSKTKGYFVEQSDHTMLFARTSAPKSPMVIEELRMCPVTDVDAIAEAIHAVQPKPGPSGYVNACCGVYPAKRLVRRASLELKRTKEPTYFPDLLTTQFRIEPDKFTIHLINAVDGTDYDVSKTTQKDVLFCGLPSEDIITVQDSLLAAGIYPDALELGTVSTLGALVDYFAFTKSKTPTLVLEIGTDITHSFIVSSSGVEASRPIPQGLDAMVPIVQKELGLKDEESAKKLFYSNTFDFTGMGPLLVKKLLKELQSSIGFYEVQTGQSVGQVICTMLPTKLSWLDGAISSALGVSSTKLDLVAWLQSRQVTLPEGVAPDGVDLRWLGLLSLMTNQPPTTASDAVAAEKKPDADAASEMPPWHPNLRNFARLPDTKVVRTAFFINGASVFIAVGLLLWFSYQEYELHNLDRQIADWDRQIDRDKKDSDQFIALYKRFQDEQARINEVDGFVKSRPAVSKLLMRLGDTLPKDIALDAYEEQPLGVVVKGSVRGTPDEASGYATAYLDQLRADKVLNLYFEDFSFTGTGISRNTQNGRLSVQLMLKFRTPSKGAKK